MKIRLGIITFFLVAFSFLMSTPFIVNAVTVTGDCQEPLETDVVQAINAYRVANGLPNLRRDDILSAAAEHFEQDMTHYGYGDHVLHDGTTWSENIHNHGYSIYYVIGENITAGYAGDTAQAAVNRWIASPSHKANILSTQFTAIGVGHGTAATGNPDPYVHYWVADFGGLNEATADLC